VPEDKNNVKICGVISEVLTPAGLLDVLAGYGAPGVPRAEHFLKVKQRSLLGFFPDQTHRNIAFITEYSSGSEDRNVPAVVLSAGSDKFDAEATVLSVRNLEKNPLFTIEGDIRFLRLLLMLTADTMDARQWKHGPDKEKWTIALLLYRWLCEDGRPNWDARALELSSKLYIRPPLLPNTLHQKVRRLLKKLG
jgi:hypothetical protein